MFSHFCGTDFFSPQSFGLIRRPGIGGWFWQFLWKCVVCNRIVSELDQGACYYPNLNTCLQLKPSCVLNVGRNRVHPSLRVTARSIFERAPEPREPVERAGCNSQIARISTRSSQFMCMARYLAWQNHWLHCIDIRFWSLHDHASSSASSAKEKIFWMQTSHTIHPCLPRMVAIARMLSPPRCMYGICVDGGASHVETRSLTLVWSAPGPGSVRACFLSRTHCTNHRCTFPMSGYWVVCEEHFWLCSEHWLPSSMLVQKIDSREPPFTKLCWCSRGEVAPSDTRRTTTGKTPLLLLADHERSDSLLFGIASSESSINEITDYKYFSPLKRKFRYESE